MGGMGVVSRRLSKPRTNTSSTNLLSWSDTPVEMPSSPLTSSDMDCYFGEQATTVSSQGDRRSRRKSRSKLRAYLYGSSPQESSQSFSSDEDEERHNSLVDAARGAKKRLSRTGSSIMQLSSAKASTNYLSSTSTTNLQSTDHEESVRVAEQIKERARLDKIAAQNHVSSPVDEDKHVDSVMAPLRRKSLYTPGIATRQSSDILRKPPPPQSIESQEDRAYYYNPIYPSDSPLATLAALSHTENGRDTPTNDVTHLGELQLGTLRVTNGRASPSSVDSISIRHHRSISLNSDMPEDFQTASEGSDNEGRGTPTHLERNLTIKASPEAAKRFRPMTQVITNMKQDERKSSEKRKSFPFRHEPSDPASVMAKEYASEFGGSPYSYSDTPILNESAGRGNHDFDEGIELSCSQEAGPQAADMRSLRSMIDTVEPVGDSQGTREDAFSKLNGSTNAPKETAYKTSTPGSDSGYSSKTSSNAGQHEPNSRDSSHGSKLQRKSLKPRLVSGPIEMPEVRSKKEAKETTMEPPPQIRPSFTVIPRHALAVPEPSVTSTGALQTISNVRASARSPSQVLVKKLQKVRPKSLPPPPVNTITVQGYRDLEQVHIPRVPSVIAARHAERLTRFPLLDHTFPSSEHVSASRTSTLTQAYNVPIRFPSPAIALESTAAGHVDQHMNSEVKALASIQTTDDERGPSTLVKSPSWSAFGGAKQKKLEKKAVKEQREAEKRLAKEEKEQEKKLAKNRKEIEKQMKRDGSKETTNRSRRSSWGRAKSSERRSSERDTPSAIADFGTVTESLGASPYDIARLTQSTDEPSQQRMWHPHQIGTAMPRTRPADRVDTSRVSAPSPARGRPRSQSIDRPGTPANGTLGAVDRADGNRVHSRPQTMYAEVPPVPALSAVDLRHHNLEWARHHQRNRSLSKARGDERPLRPQSMAVETARVSAQPSSDRVQQKIEVKRSRPQSMAGDPHIEQFIPSRRSREQSRSGSKTSPKSRKLLKYYRIYGPVARWRGGFQGKLSPQSNDLKYERLDSDNEVWKVQQKAWSERRKSAGEALFLKNQIKDIFESKDPLTVVTAEEKPRPQSTISKSVTTDFSGLDHNMKTRRPAPSPLVPSTGNATPFPRTRDSANQYPCESRGQQRVPSFPTPAERRAQSRPQSIPRKRVESGHSTPRSASQNRSSVAISKETPPVPRSVMVDSAMDPSPHAQRLMGRYDGGLQYGYEPGQGLGGSAGTRNSKTLASRKSVEVSKGYGIDLSDVPVFFAPAVQ